VAIAELDLADWRRRVAELYAAIRADDDPVRAHARWRSVRDELIGKHPQSPARPGDPLRQPDFHDHGTWSANIADQVP